MISSVENVKSAHQWMKYRKEREGAEELWRVHDHIYDLNDWIEKHPGGSQWLILTKGTDITEAFEAHHIGPLAEETLSKFLVKKAATPRAHPYTFFPDGFYRTLKKRVGQEMANIPKGLELKSIIIMDSLVLASVALSLASAAYRSFFVATVAGIALALTTICAHNFIHIRQNWRMYYFHIGAFSITDWRMTHMLSHHIYTNTIYDLEISLFKPFFEWLPRKDKSFVVRYLSWIYFPIVYAFTSIEQAVHRILNKRCEKADIVTLMIPTMMIVLTASRSTDAVAWTLVLWIWMLICCSFVTTAIGLNAGHHHPRLYHDGDAPRDDMDWGLHQLDTTSDRVEFRKNTFFALISFGDHNFHHLFPSLDHSYSPYIYPIIERTCQDFQTSVKSGKLYDHATGQFAQLARVCANEKSQS